MIDNITYLFEHAGSSSKEWQHISYLYGYFAVDYDQRLHLGLSFALYCSCVVVFYILILDILFDFIDKGGLNFMKQKIIPFLCICMIVVLSVPSVPALADEPVDVKCYTTESVYDYFTGSVGETDKQDIADLIYRVPNTFVTSDVISALQNFPSDPNNGNSSPLTSGYWFVAVNSSINQMAVYWPLESFNDVDIDWSAASPCLTVNTTGEVCFNACFNETDSNARYYMMVSYYNLNTHTWGSPTGYTMTQTNDSDHLFYFKIYNTYGTGRPTYILSASDNLHYLYSGTEFKYFTNNSGTYNHTDFLLSIYKGLYNYTNYLPSTLPYYNGSEIITPDDGNNVETNENHMYFNSCDFGFCEPLNVNSFSNFGGAYFYCNYSVDSWVRDHINDYSIVFSAIATIGDRQYNGTVVSKLDPDMCLTLPFNAVFSNFSNLGFSTYVTNKKIDGNYLKTYLYSVDPNNYLSFYNSVSSGSSGNSLSDALNKLIQSDANSTGVLAYTSDSLSQVIKQNILTTEFLNGLYFHNNYKFRVQAYLIDNDGNESGAVARLFDIVKGSSTSVDNQGLTNEDPFESDDDTGEQLPIIPDNTSTVGYSTSGGFVNNINIPSEYSVTYRDGVNTFIDWFNKDPEVTGIQNSFWGALGVFKGNPANELYSDYFSFLPDGFKSIIFGCAGIGIIGAAATILRKRLMK